MARSRVRVDRGIYLRWGDAVEKKVHQFKGRQVSTADAVLLKVYDRALAGDKKSIRQMVKMARANMKERQEYERFGPCTPVKVVERRWRACLREERTADPALLLLGIAVVENAALERLGDPADPEFDACAVSLRPTHIADWVAEYALSRGNPPDAHYFRQNVRSIRTLSEDSANCSKWQGMKGKVLERMVALRGPAGARFASGTCGNPHGRPRTRGKPSEILYYPFDGFFMEPVPIEHGGMRKWLSRLDALMLMLSRKAINDEEIAEIMTAHHRIQEGQCGAAADHIR
jgi:hypothetical protein